MAIRTLRVTAISAQKNAHVYFVFLFFDVGEVLAYSGYNSGALIRVQVTKRNVEPDLAFVFRLEMFPRPPMLRLIPRIDRAFFERKRRIGNDEIQVVIDR